jgi:hypothetical protein
MAYVKTDTAADELAGNNYACVMIAVFVMLPPVKGAASDCQNAK